MWDRTCGVREDSDGSVLDRDCRGRDPRSLWKDLQAREDERRAGVSNREPQHPP